MRILAVSDEIVPRIYHPSVRERFGEVELVLGCGDLPPSYLEFIVSSLDVPCLYVPGNHDGQPEHTDYGLTLTQPAGCICIDGRIRRHGGLVIGGLGGSLWYNGGAHQYSQRQMFVRVWRLLPRILWYRRANGYGLDILITHAPPAGINDGTGAHAGFTALRWLIERYPPRFLIHGHVHKNYRLTSSYDTRVGTTRVINASGYRLLTVEPLASLRWSEYNPSRHQQG